MIDLKAHIYSLLAADETIADLVGSNIHIFSDDSEQMENFVDRLPQITYARLALVPSITGVRNEIFQISAWSDNPKGAEELSQEIVRLFNRTSDTTYRACNVSTVNDSFDHNTKSFGIHVTAKFTIYDPAY